ncbi:MAG: hypothetical protein L6U99_00145 [Clostridium sp.]|nr:MAG: hypothetical protein L6U99_00145 [Clostridium sp.]
MKVIDMHCDTIMGLYFNKDKHLRDYDGMISLEKNAKRRLYGAMLCDVCSL